MYKFIILLLYFFMQLNFCYSQWNDVQGGINAWVNTFYVDSATNLLFVGGNYEYAGGMSMNSIATWDGVNWNTFGNNAVLSSPGSINAIVNYNGDIIIGGEFDSIGSVPVNNIARWNGSDWESIGPGFNSSVGDLIVFNGELYACGFFSYSDTNFVECVAKWDGTKWVRVSLLIGYANTMEIYDGKLIIGGSFFHQMNSQILGIAAWNGATTDSSYGVFSPSILSLRNIDDTLYAVGRFTSHAWNPSNFISIYYNQSWHSIGAPTGGSNWVTDVEKFNNEIYFSGYFTNPPDLCKSNGTGFDSVADVIGFIKCLEVYKGDLYAGGLFTQLNGMNIYNIARYHDSGNSIEFDLMERDKILCVYPNPCTEGKLNIKINQDRSLGIRKMELLTIESEVIYARDQSGDRTNFMGLELKIENGVYILKCLLSDGSIHTKKIIVL